MHQITELSKRQYYFNLFTTCINNSSDLWKTINDLVKYKKPCKVGHTSKIRINLNEIIQEGIAVPAEGAGGNCPPKFLRFGQN